jgi:hypothetical protein
VPISEGLPALVEPNTTQGKSENGRNQSAKTHEHDNEESAAKATNTPEKDKGHKDCHNETDEHT